MSIPVHVDDKSLLRLKTFTEVNYCILCDVPKFAQGMYITLTRKKKKLPLKKCSISKIMKVLRINGKIIQKNKKKKTTLSCLLILSSALNML